jgi:hypothetical protein
LIVKDFTSHRRLCWLLVNFSYGNCLAAHFDTSNGGTCHQCELLAAFTSLPSACWPCWPTSPCCYLWQNPVLAKSCLWSNGNAVTQRQRSAGDDGRQPP